jgi:hypothetical protein
MPDTFLKITPQIDRYPIRVEQRVVDIQKKDNMVLCHVVISFPYRPPAAWILYKTRAVAPAIRKSRATPSQASPEWRLSQIFEESGRNLRRIESWKLCS